MQNQTEDARTSARGRHVIAHPNDLILRRRDAALDEPRRDIIDQAGSPPAARRMRSQAAGQTENFVVCHPKKAPMNQTCRGKAAGTLSSVIG
jgi:hypothetical protein